DEDCQRVILARTIDDDTDFFFFQAEDGIRYRNVTGVQTCALPILVDRVLVGAVLDEDAVLEEDVGSLENILAGVGRESEMVESAAFLGPVIGVDDVVGLLLEAVPPGTVASIIEGDAYGFAGHHHIRPEFPGGGDIGSEVVDVVETARVDP